MSFRILLRNKGPNLYQWIYLFISSKLYPHGMRATEHAAFRPLLQTFRVGTCLYDWCFTTQLIMLIFFLLDSTLKNRFSCLSIFLQAIRFRRRRQIWHVLPLAVTQAKMAITFICSIQVYICMMWLNVLIFKIYSKTLTNPIICVIYYYQNIGGGAFWIHRIIIFYLLCFNRWH